MYYGDLKKASSEVIKALEYACPGTMESQERPMSLREQIKDILKRQMEYYFDKK